MEHSKNQNDVALSVLYGRGHVPSYIERQGSMIRCKANKGSF